MKTEYHIIAGSITSAALIPVLGVNSAAFFASSVLIDVDHYLDYVYRNRFTDFSVRRMFAYNNHLDEAARGRHFVHLSVMHTVEFLLLVYIIAALTDLVLIEAFLWGFLFHLACDLIDLYRQGALFQRALSILEYLIRWDILKRKGLHLELPHDLALEAVLPKSESIEENEEG